jgi:hypothetical protein
LCRLKTNQSALIRAFLRGDKAEGAHLAAPAAKFFRAVNPAARMSTDERARLRRRG